jgi:hypothetical protein
LTVARALRRACDSVGVDYAPFASWAALASPTPSEGPLAHDVLLPAPGRSPSVGINLFLPGREVAALAEAWAAEHLGAVAQAAVAEVTASAARVAGGVAWRGGELWVKLYLVDRDVVGIDIGARGAARRRAYHHEGLVWLEGWNAPSLPALPGVSHRLVGVLGDEKRSLNLIFGPRASLDDLRRVAAAVPLPSCLDESLLEHGLRPAAYEIDLYRDRRETDVLVTVASEQLAP